MQGTPYRGDVGGSEPMPLDVRAAFRRWSRSVFGAPRSLDEQITAIEERDEVLTRVATEVIRRDLFEQRIPTHRRARKNARPVDPATLDPFGESLEELRERTEHTDCCDGCGGGGLVACLECKGTGRERCSHCGGQGQELRHYKKSSKYVRCTVCRGGGTVSCGVCGAKGKITCSRCAGGGEQLVWWAYNERVRVVVQIAPESPILLAHSRLREERLLKPEDLWYFTLFVNIEASGPVHEGQLAPDDESLRRRLTPALAPQLERIRSQQFLQFGVLRRDVRYEMCGTSGHVVLSGANLVGASMPDAVRPIQRRLILWCVAALVVALICNAYHTALSGSAAYFQSVNQTIAVVLMLGYAAVLIAIGSLLRKLRSDLSFWPIGIADRVAAGVFVAALLAGPLIGYLGRPREEEVRAAITAGDLDRARFVADALRATRPAREVSDVTDELQLAEADRLSGDERLASLDDVAARNGARASEARARAQRERVDAIQAALAAGSPADALGALERWSSALPESPDLDELKAQAFDKKAELCGDDVCKFAATAAARRAHSTPDRNAAAERVRGKLFQELTIGSLPNDDLLRRVRSLRAVSVLAAATQTVAREDAELLEKARSASSLAAAERSKIALIGAPAAAVHELLDRAGGSSGAVGWPELQGVLVYVSEAGGRCKGLYVVGATEGARAISGREAGLNRLLGQATGRPGATLHDRSGSSRTHEVTKWVEGSTPIVTRWSGNILMELRIGDASP